MSSSSARLLWPLRNAEERRLRAGWRIVAMLATYLLLTIASMGLVETLFEGTHRLVASAIAILGVGLLAAWLPTRYLDRRPFGDLGLHVDRRAMLDLLLGAGLGLVLTGGVLVVYLALGWAEIVDWFVGDDASFAVSFTILAATYASVAVLEEVLFRGYLIVNLTDGFDRLRQVHAPGWLARSAHGLPVVAAVLVSSVLFAHFHGEELTGLQYLHFTLAGIMLAIPYVVTGSLALPIGLHWTFNVGATGLFNIEGGVPALLRLDLVGPAAWVGETALTETLAIACLLPVVLVVARRRQRADASIGPLAPASDPVAAR
jgi:membrane protease YdiL (CAAX protease family)